MNLAADLRLLAEPFSVAELAQAQALARARGSRLVDLLLDAGAADSATDAEPDPAVAAQRLARLGATAGMQTLSMKELHALRPAFDRLPFGEAQRRECLLLEGEAQQLLLVVADPFDLQLRDWAGERVGAALAVRLACSGDIAAYFARHEESLRAMDSVLPAQQGTQHSSTAQDISLKSIHEDASPVVRLVNSTLYDALKAGASDIHLETDSGCISIKYRIDGVLASIGTQGMEHAEQIISRIKVMSELDIAERRVPQDGRFKVAAGGREIDIRVSIMPSIHGEDAVLRILDKQRLSDKVDGLRLAALGFDATTMRALHALCAEPYGMFLATGPTGSGKTTTLYAAINEINHGHDKIITIEDPVEYQLGGVLQIPVNEKKGLTFARGLRSILRHDPDKIMVGEIRDGETAQIAVQAALTGHLVLTTVHANNVFDVIGRFTHMGVDPYSLVAALNGIVAQRLVRVSCPHCLSEVVPDAQLLAASGIADVAGYRFMAGTGCAHCRGTGYRGRKAVAEVLVLDDELREMIVTREPVRRIKEAAYRKGTRLLRDAGLDLVRNGETTLQELNRVVA